MRSIAFDPNKAVDLERFTDISGRNLGEIISVHPGEVVGIRRQTCKLRACDVATI
jgi:hypothetical protein